MGRRELQPSASIAYKGFSLEAWGSVGIEKTNADGYDAKELDLILGYSTGGFSISITDYWFNTGAGYFHYSAHNTAHLYEAQLGYDFGPVAVTGTQTLPEPMALKKTVREPIHPTSP